ncbi:MAG: phage portal protein, partial [Clostridia bacterium]
MSNHFRLDDNTFLDARYVKQIKETTPSGMFYDRGVEGLWVSGEGVVYPDFDREKHSITAEQTKRLRFDRVFAGVDWGWEHWGAIVVIGVIGKRYCIIEEHAAQHRFIDDWIATVGDIIARHGDISFYCDPARTEHVAAFQKAGIRAYLANNRVLSGIEAVATLMKNDLFRIVYDECPRFRDEIYKYIWKKNSGEPLKENDDVLCAIRYGIYSDMTILEEMPQKETEQCNETERNAQIMTKVNEFEYGEDTRYNPAKNFQQLFGPESNRSYRAASAEEILDDQQKLINLINHHNEKQCPRLAVLDDYIKARNDGIYYDDTRRTEKEKADHRAAHNFAKIINVFDVGYNTGIPIKKTSDDERVNEIITQYDDDNDIEALDSELWRDFRKYGRAYELQY